MEGHSTDAMINIRVVGQKLLRKNYHVRQTATWRNADASIGYLEAH